METQYYHHGHFHFEGGSLPNAITAYRTHGDPKNPCIVFPTCYGGRLDSQYYLVGEGKTLDTSKYFVVTFSLFSNGESSSPSNTPSPYNGPYFPKVSYADNIRAQHAVLTKKLGVQRIFCVVGFSMGGQQTYYWATMYPEMVERYKDILGVQRRSSEHCQDLFVFADQLEQAFTIDGDKLFYFAASIEKLFSQNFLEGPKAALVASRDFEFGHYAAKPQAGIRAFGRVYSAWAYGQTWFRQHGYKVNGQYPDLESWLRGEWEGRFLAWDANDLLVLMNTWSNGDISLIRDGGQYEKTLQSIRAKALIMPSRTDLYFPPEDSEIEVSHLPNAKLAIMDTVWGHVAGGGANEKDIQFMHEHITAFFDS